MKYTSFGFSGTLYQWFDLGSQGVSGLLTNQTPSPRLSNQNWSSIGLRPSSIQPRVCPLYPKPRSGFFCIFMLKLGLPSFLPLQWCPIHSSTSSWYLAHFLSFAFPCALPRVLWGPAWSVAWWNLTQWSGRNCIDVVLAGNFSYLPRSLQVPSQLRWWGGHTLPWVVCGASSQLLGVGGLRFVVTLLGVDGSGNTLSNCLERQAAAEEMFQGSPPWREEDMTGSYFCPRDGGLQDLVIHCKQAGLKSSCGGTPLSWCRIRWSVVVMFSPI